MKIINVEKVNTRLLNRLLAELNAQFYKEGELLNKVIYHKIRGKIWGQATTELTIEILWKLRNRDRSAGASSTKHGQV